MLNTLEESLIVRWVVKRIIKRIVKRIVRWIKDICQGALNGRWFSVAVLERRKRRFVLNEDGRLQVRSGKFQ